jgi:uncharacterized protein YhfF
VTPEQYWEQCRRARPDVATAEFRARRFGRTPEEAARMVELLRSGAFTGTFTPLIELQSSPEPLPKRGDCCVVTDFDDRPGCVIRVVAVQSLPFEQVSALQTRHGIPEERDPEIWRQRHHDEWKEQLARAGHAADEEMMVFFQQFEVLYAA